jgi:hypothetical protein
MYQSDSNLRERPVDPFCFFPIEFSETFLDFAAPLLRHLPNEAPERRAREALQVCFTAWNAVVFSGSSVVKEQPATLTMSQPARSIR